ncbi:MAG: hypothetical protein GJ671_09570 [Alteromonadaceae bacterium]|nr:hypothetical protein [Alteromonadaceae bacterium]
MKYLITLILLLAGCGGSSDVKTYENGTKVGKLPDGRKVDQHASSGKSGKGSNVEQGTQSIKIKNESGKRIQTTVRYPEDKQ